MEWILGGGPEEESFLRAVSTGMLACGALALAALQVQTAPYGRYEAAASRSWGPRFDARVAWVLQECPCVVLPAWHVAAHAARGGAAPPPRACALLACFLFHYINRTFVYPLRMRGGRPTPVSVFALALGFCVVNGHLQSRWLLHFSAAEQASRPLLVFCLFIYYLFSS